MMWDHVQKRIDGAISRARNAVFGMVCSVLKEDNEVYVKLSEEDEIRDITIVAPFGFYSLPDVGVLGQVVFNNSNKKSSLVGVDDRRGRPVEVDSGEVLIYNPTAKSYIILKKDKTLEVSNGAAKITLKDDGTIDIVSPKDINVTGKNINLSANEKIDISAPKGVSITASDASGGGVAITGKNSSQGW